LLSRSRAWTRAATTLSRRRPELFRKFLLLDAASGQFFDSCLQPFQREDFEALDPAWRSLSKLTRRAGGGVIHDDVRRRLYIERPRGHSKTSDIAVQIAWILLAADHEVRGLAAAADRDQANLIHEAIERLARINPQLCRELSFIQHEVRNRSTGSRLQVISSDVRSSWGSLPDFVVCDELCHWKGPELWHSLASSAAKKPDCLLTVLTNAGVGRGWQWDLRELARNSPEWHFHSLDGPHAPWISKSWLEEQRALLPPAVFERLWLNRWQHSDGEFVTLAQAEACRDAALRRREEGRFSGGYVATIDYAEKHDLTVGCVCHLEGVTVIVDRMDVVRPSPQNTTPVAWVDAWIERTGLAFVGTRFVLDPHQLVPTIQRLGGRHRIERFDFAAGVGNHRLAKVLHQLILDRRVAWYPGCGEIDEDFGGHPPHGRDDLETELASLLLRQSVSGRVRFDHRRDNAHHDDRSFALAVACLVLCESPVAEGEMIVTPPSLDGGFAF
jgi:hypothetical protein